ncbi:hypothetical protein BJK05_11170 [Pectobacterium polaris]|uniref:hypothetical protein n=1 Tax=Pectobacterium polaris TaxID=2042057 RepID=UPI000BAC7597|nr:hypothetical protein [Pectobacterium polaris]ASY80521.1 hypothetical protein BJK05_11170 [Pectobacterium polaris]MCA6943897.1 hypothetical protein [Pectobacterium polaris]MCA6959514.1 hypothetical protein [Pectobacterium polaris]UAY93061.1 hypothetical protein KSL88_05035 [Pectobacterium polaris]
MIINENLLKSIENGTQLGKRFCFYINDELCWSSVGIQKWEKKYKVYVDEVLESKMNFEEYLREEIIEFDFLNDAICFINDNTRVNFNELTACKGQKIFNPKFN